MYLKFFKILESFITLIIYAWFFIIGFLVTSYYLKKHYIATFFTPIKNFINNYNVFTIYQKQIEIIKEDGHTILLGIKNNFTNNTNNDLNRIRYIKIKNEHFPIIDLLHYSDKEKNIYEILDDLLNYWLIIKHNNILITHSSWKWILWSWWIKYIKEGDIVIFEDEIWNEIKYKAKKLFIMDTEEYKKTFKFLNQYIYLVTCYPIWDNKKRWIMVLEKK